MIGPEKREWKKNQGGRLRINTGRSFIRQHKQSCFIMWPQIFYLLLPRIWCGYGILRIPECVMHSCQLRGPTCQQQWHMVEEVEATEQLSHGPLSQWSAEHWRPSGRKPEQRPKKMGAICGTHQTPCGTPGTARPFSRSRSPAIIAERRTREVCTVTVNAIPCPPGFV